MDPMEWITRGTADINQAVAFDNDGQYAQALAMYTNGCSKLALGLKYLDEGFPIKSDLREKVREYLSRAESIKRVLNPPQQQQQSDNANSEASVTTNSNIGGVRAPPPPAAAGGVAASQQSDASVHAKSIMGGFVPAGKLNVRWSDVAGHDNCKLQLKQAALLPITQPQVCSVGRGTKGVLLYGPPGTGKTELARAVATEARCNFFCISVSTLANKYFGESEKIVTALFKEARQRAPCIIFIDEIDSVLKQRSDEGGQTDHGDGAKAEFLQQWDGIQSTLTESSAPGSGSLLVMGATNMPWLIDPAARRRFDRRVYIPLPDEDARVKIFKIHVTKQFLRCDFLSQDEYETLAKATTGYSGSDIQKVVTCALSKPTEFALTATHFQKHTNPADQKVYYSPCFEVEEGAIKMTFEEVPNGALAKVEPIFQDFEDAIKQTPKSVSEEDLERFVNWTKLYGVDG